MVQSGWQQDCGMWLNWGGERMTEVHDLNRAIRPFSVKHDPGELFFNDPVTVFHI
jgi:hypothetical protein